MQITFIPLPDATYEEKKTLHDLIKSLSELGMRIMRGTADMHIPYIPLKEQVNNLVNYHILFTYDLVSGDVVTHSGKVVLNIKL